ncbi:MAG: hypothetical protein GY906_22645 [bacterium]|nr:hypothetical protein [bacterium]
MTIAGLMPVRNEDWCFGYTARMALRWVDKLYILVHASGPSTQEIANTVAKEHPDRVNTFVDPEPTWNEMEHRQGLLEAARRGGATHIAVVDSDEALTANLVPEVRGLVEQTPAGHCLALPGIHPWCGLEQYRYDGPLGCAFSIVFEDRPHYCWEPRADGYQHHRRLPHALDQCGWSPSVPSGGVLHLQFARDRASRAKHARNQMIELLRWPHLGAARIRRMYSWWRQPGTRAQPQLFRNVEPSWWDQELMHHLDFSDNGGSWYEQDVKRLLEQHGREKFQGLDLFGIGERCGLLTRAGPTPPSARAL